MAFFFAQRAGASRVLQNIIFLYKIYILELHHITTTKFLFIMSIKKRFTKKIRDQIKASDRLSLDIAEALGNSRVQSTHKQIDTNSEKLMLPNIVELVRKSLNIPETEVIIEAFRNAPKKQNQKS